MTNLQVMTRLTKLLGFTLGFLCTMVGVIPMAHQLNLARLTYNIRKAFVALTKVVSQSDSKTAEAETVMADAISSYNATIMGHLFQAGLFLLFIVGCWFVVWLLIKHTKSEKFKLRFDT